MMLALGLNVTLGWAGMLDLGYVAFFGFGAYIYACSPPTSSTSTGRRSRRAGRRRARAAALGLLLGLTSWRLPGDYFAIVTLFFLQIFLTLSINIDGPDLPSGRSARVDITDGPNGISTVDPFEFFGASWARSTRTTSSLSASSSLVSAAMYLVNHSRIGRGWRSLREDLLAAELMGMRVHWLKLSRFAFGAAVAGLAGLDRSRRRTARLPVDFDLTVLITVYAMVILGGLGSLAGVMLGAIVLNVALEVLREPERREHRLFPTVLVVTLAVIRPLWRWAAVAAATLVFGVVAHAVVEQLWPRESRAPLAGGLGSTSSRRAG